MQVIKHYLGFKSITKTLKGTEKLLHQLLFGPGGTGKSHCLHAASDLTPAFFINNCVHVSNQEQFADQTNTCQRSMIVQIHEEQRAEALGMESGGSTRRVKNSMDESSTELKNKLTNRVIDARSLVITKQGRVHVHLSRSNEVCFYHKYSK